MSQINGACMCIGMGSFTRALEAYQESHPWEKYDFSLPWQLSIAENPSPGDMTLWDSLLCMPECWLADSWTALMQVTTAAVSLWAQWPHFISGGHYFTEVLPQHQVFTINLFTPSSMMVPEPFWVGMIYRAEHSMVFYALQIDQLSVSGLTTAYYNK